MFAVVRRDHEMEINRRALGRTDGISEFNVREKEFHARDTASIFEGARFFVVVETVIVCNSENLNQRSWVST